MRTLLLPLSALAISIFACAQGSSNVASTVTPGDLYIPAVLDKGIRTEKAHVGDEVRLDLLEPVLAGPGVVIPGSAHLYGHIVDSEPLQGRSESRLAIEVDRAEWRHSRLPLHAFVSGIGERRDVIQRKSDPRCNSTPVGAASNARGPGLATDFDDVDSCLWNQSGTVFDEHRADLNQVKLELHHADGSTAFVSGKKNIHLPGGLLLMLHNVPKTAAPDASMFSGRWTEPAPVR